MILNNCRWIQKQWNYQRHWAYYSYHSSFGVFKLSVVLLVILVCPILTWRYRQICRDVIAAIRHPSNQVLARMGGLWCESSRRVEPRRRGRPVDPEATLTDLGDFDWTPACEKPIHGDRILWPNEIEQSASCRILAAVGRGQGRTSGRAYQVQIRLEAYSCSEGIC